MPQRISIIAAVARNRVIGLNNRLPWQLPEDLKHFRNLTMGHHIIMGRKTYESVGRLLPGRVTVIVSRHTGYSVEGAMVAESLPDAIQLCGNDEEIFLIGGAGIYREALDLASRMYLTEIDAEFPGDAWFPAYDPRQWNECSREKHLNVNGIPFSFVTYERVQS